MSKMVVARTGNRGPSPFVDDSIRNITLAVGKHARWYSIPTYLLLLASVVHVRLDDRRSDGTAVKVLWITVGGIIDTLMH